MDLCPVCGQPEYYEDEDPDGGPGQLDWYHHVCTRTDGSDDR